MGRGLAIAEKFQKEGYIVIITSRREKEGKEAEARLRTQGEAMWIQADCANKENCKAVTDIVMKQYKRLDVLVNNAAVTGQHTDFLELNLEETERVINLNVMGTLNMMKYAAKVIKNNGRGVIINISSLCGFIANHESVAYYASKGAVNMITRSGARELSPYGIRVVGVAPGWVQADMVDTYLAEHPDEKEYGGKLHMRDRIITPEEIASVVYMVSDDGAYAINGSTVMVDVNSGSY